MPGNAVTVFWILVLIVLAFMVIRACPRGTTREPDEGEKRTARAAEPPPDGKLYVPMWEIEIPGLIKDLRGLADWIEDSHRRGAQPLGPRRDLRRLRDQLDRWNEISAEKRQEAASESPASASASEAPCEAGKSEGSPAAAEPAPEDEATAA